MEQFNSFDGDRDLTKREAYRILVREGYMWGCLCPEFKFHGYQILDSTNKVFYSVPCRHISKEKAQKAAYNFIIGMGENPAKYTILNTYKIMDLSIRA